MSSSNQRNIHLRLFLFTTIYDRLLLFLGCFFAILSGSSKPLQGFITNNIATAFIHYSRGISTNNASHAFDNLYNDVTFNCLWWFALATFTFVTCFLQTYLLQLAGENVSNRLQQTYLKSLLSQDISWFDSQKTGSLITEMIRNLDKVKEGTGPHIGQTVHNIVQLMGSFLVCMWYDWRLGQISTCLIPLIAIFGKHQQRKLKHWEKESQKARREADEAAEQALTSIRTVMYFNGQEEECRRYQTCLDKISAAGIGHAFVEGTTSAVNNLITYGSCALTVLYGTYCVYNGTVEGGVIVMIFMQIRISLVQVNRLVAFTGKYTSALVAADCLFAVIDKKPDVVSPWETSEFPILTGQIRVKDVAFSYPSRPDMQVLKGIDLAIEPGQTIALVGASGCGKSTLIQLLLRLYDATSGQIFFDDNDIKSIDLAHLRRAIGVVSQEPILFNTTIEENIRCGNEDVSEADIWSILKEANAYDFVKRFPKGLQTLVGERGAQLSGGQKQRIAIARALLRDPKILLLDEATSALDAECEKVVQQALDNASKGRTTIVVAHRLSTIRNADQIVVVKHGKMVETGSHDSLLEKRGLYYDLITSQIIRSNGPTDVAKGSYRQSVSMEEDSHLREKVPKKTGKGAVTKSIFWRLWAEVEVERKLLSAAVFISLFRGLVAPAGFFTFSELTNIYSGSKPDILDQGIKFGLFYILLAFFQAVFQYSQPVLFGTSVNRVANRLRSKTYRNLVRQDAAFYDRPSNSPGHLLIRLTNDVGRIMVVINSRVGKLLQEICTDVVGCTLGLYFCWQISIIAIPAFPLAVLCTYWRHFVMLRKMVGNEREKEKCGQLAIEAVSQIRTVKSLNLESVLYRKFCDQIESTRKFHNDLIFSQSCSQGLLISIHYYLYSVLYLIGLVLIRDFHVDSQMFIRSMYLIGWGSTCIASWLYYQPDLLKATVSAKLLFALLDEEPEIDSTSQEGKRPEIIGNVKVRNIHFRYPEREGVEVVKGVSLEIKKEQTVALVGSSGSGKSTIVSMIERLYDPEGGSIEFDGNPAPSINVQHLRSNISIVSQEPVLFDISIRENIIYGLDKEQIPEAKIQEAAEKAKIHSFIMSLPEGYGTRVGDKGTQLSGGQKQRIAIARALVREPKILVLDEATSALDTESEKHVQLALDQAKTGRSCLVIAHRLSTIRNAHQIVVLEKGSIVERGTHEELMQKTGAYFRLVQKQTQE